MARAETETETENSAQSMIAFRQADYDIFNLKVPPSNISGRRFLIRSHPSIGAASRLEKLAATQ